MLVCAVITTANAVLQALFQHWAEFWFHLDGSLVFSELFTDGYKESEKDDSSREVC